MVSGPSAGISSGDGGTALAIACQSSVFPRQTLMKFLRSLPRMPLSAQNGRSVGRRRRPQRAVETVGRIGRCGRLQRRLSFTPSSAHRARARRLHGEPRGRPKTAQSTPGLVVPGVSAPDRQRSICRVRHARRARFFRAARARVPLSVLAVPRVTKICAALGQGSSIATTSTALTPPSLKWLRAPALRVRRPLRPHGKRNGHIVAI